MNTPSNAVEEARLDAQGMGRAVLSAIRPLYWSVRREFWENRSIYIAPLAAAALFLFGFMISMVHLPARVRAAALIPGPHMELSEQAYVFAALLLMGTALIVSVFYCLDALHGERRDRSTLFWKSLPVSDVTTVLSKAIIPIFLLPLLASLITIGLWIVMRLLSGAVLLGSGLSMPAEWSELSLFQMSMMLLYHLVAIHGLWYAPFYAWMLLVSAWARRAPFLWATVPLFAIGIVEKIAFGTLHFAHMLGYRFSGGDVDDTGSKASGVSTLLMPHLVRGQFLLSPSLWIGLAITAIFLAAAVRVRRCQGPI